MLADIPTNERKPEALPQLASCLKAAGDPLRLEILRVLACDSYGVMELSRLFETKQSGMSHHLKVLAAAGWVASRREGNSIFYRRATPGSSDQLDPTLTQLQHQLFLSLDETAISPELCARVRAIQDERASTSQQFFAENFGKFREQQDLIASYPIYAEQVSEQIQQLASTLGPDAQALELGPGEGEFLEVLSPLFDQVIALDNAPSMLARAEQFAREKSLANLSFIAGDTREALRRKLSVDCIVVNMVLHHTPSPADIFQDLSRLLKPGGRILVTDLCRHDQSWAKEACGDLWQGFDPEDFSRWALQAGLKEGPSVYFALRNGFQVQVRQFMNDASPSDAHFPH
jgi:ArsR family transcriptional regulator